MRTLPMLLATGLLLGALAACGSDDPEPKLADPTASIAATSSSTPTTELPTSTPPATESAEDFIARFNEAAVEMQVSGVSADFRRLTSNCASCDALADNVDDVYRKGGHIETGRNTVQDAKRVGGHDGVLIYEYELISSATTIFKKDGSKDLELPGGSERYQINLTKDGRIWSVQRLAQLV